ncbi:heme oxygenase (biliverdin-producing) [uncultured Nevskia sp.]|uniref:biliverdin-producing heme oxygenase n=1 Tax=uncultured Nevskia sp. TaxID=228950 RepID=UPI0025E121B7|nr:biliverdin-producing heme oxygenase [uncultured Nevskia sp.]
MTLSTSLATRLRSATGSLHREVEGSPLIANLLRGALDRAGYCLMLRNLQPIYAALEARLPALAEDPVIACIFDPVLARLPALEADLVTLHGADWPSLPLQVAAKIYQGHLLQLDAPGLVAHAYVRYLGDLAGGQMLARIVRRALSLEGDRGTAFYAFPSPGAAVLGQCFRDGLDRIVLLEAALDRIVDEACLGFRWHGDLFRALGADRDLPQRSPLPLA